MKKYIARLLIVSIALAVGAAIFAYHSRPAGAPGAGAALPKNPAVMGTLVSSTPNSVIISTQGGSPQTFSVSSTTQVVTQVQAGEVGKALSEISNGTNVFVQPHSPGSLVADRISIASAPTVSNTDPAGPPVVAGGTLVATTTSSITLKTATDPNLHIAIDKNTIIISNVLAGEKGKTFDDAYTGLYLQVAGIVTGKGFVARSIQLLLPIR